MSDMGSFLINVKPETDIKFIFPRNEDDEFFFVVRVGVYDQGTCGVFASAEEAVDAACELIKLECDSYHNFEVRGPFKLNEVVSPDEQREVRRISRNKDASRITIEKL